jgi:hypothetical protein
MPKCQNSNTDVVRCFRVVPPFAWPGCAIPVHEAEASHYECLPPKVGEAQRVMNHVTPSSSLLP